MKTVKRLKEELSKFPEDAECHAYEGEVTGIIINKNGKQGVILCSESSDAKEPILFSSEGEQ